MKSKFRKFLLVKHLLVKHLLVKHLLVFILICSGFSFAHANSKDDTIIEYMRVISNDLSDCDFMVIDNGYFENINACYIVMQSLYEFYDIELTNSFVTRVFNKYSDIQRYKPFACINDGDILAETAYIINDEYNTYIEVYIVKPLIKNFGCGLCITFKTLK